MAGLPFVLVGAVFVKNDALFGDPTLSSWSGFNAQRGVVAAMTPDQVDAAIAAGEVSTQAKIAPWQGLDAYPPVNGRCTSSHDAAVVSDPVKDKVGPFTIPNFNDECYLPLYQRSRDDTAALIRRQPGRYLDTRRDPLLLTFGIDDIDARDAGATDALGITQPQPTWMDRIFEPVLLPVGVELDQSDWNLQLFGERYPFQLSITLLTAYALVLVRSVVGVAAVILRSGLRHPDRWSSHDVTWAVIGLTVAMVTVGGALIEFGENARFRSALDPLVVALALHTLWGCARWGSARRRAGISTKRRGANELLGRQAIPDQPPHTSPS